MPLTPERLRLDWLYAVIQNPDLTREQAIGILQNAVCAGPNADAGVDAAIAHRLDGDGMGNRNEFAHVPAPA